MKRSLVALLLTISTVTGGWFFIDFGRNYFPLHGDALGYYMYLPSKFIYHNLSALDWLPEDKGIGKDVLNHIKSSFLDRPRSPKGYFMIKYTYGVAAMESPFFFIAHFYERVTGRLANGYSKAYINALKCSMLFYGLAGLVLLYHILRRFYDRYISLVTVWLILMGSNLFWFTFYHAGMSHVPLFFLYTLLIYATIRAHEQFKLNWIVLTGLVAGLITIIRPIDIVCLFIPVLYGISSKESLLAKLKMIRQQALLIPVFGLAFLVPLLPQMAYWKKFAGSFLYYSYVNEKFDFLSPHLREGLFYGGNGWLAYSPIMLFAILGFVFMAKAKELKFSLYCMFPIYVYLAYSWYCYNYINGFGSRPMLHMYPILAFALAGFLDFMKSRNLVSRWALSLVCLFLVFFNVSLSRLDAKGLLISEESNWTYNLHMLFKAKASYADLVVYDEAVVQPDTNKLAKIANLQCLDFEDSLSNRYVRDTSGRSKFVYCIWDQDEYMQTQIIVPYHEETMKTGDWLKASGQFYCWHGYDYFKHILVVDIWRDGKVIHHYPVAIDNKLGLTDMGAKPEDYNLYHYCLNKWSNIYFYFPITEDLRKGDEIHMFVWNYGMKNPMYMDNLCLEQYRRR